MKKMVIFTLFMVVLSILGGCVTTEVFDKNYNKGELPVGTHDVKIWQSHWLFRLISNTNVHLGDDLCPEGEDVIKVRHRFHVGHELVGLVTLGIWTPSVTYVWCGESQ